MAEKHVLFCLGHPLLDIQVRNAEQLLIKYNLNADDAILAEEQHFPIYQEVISKYNITYVSGGAAQNTARGAAYILPPDSVVFVGCVGDDKLAELLRITNAREGVRDLYQVQRNAQTGACAVLLTGQNRSLVTALHSAKMLTLDHITSPELESFKSSARVFYVEGYILSHRADAALYLAAFAVASGKTFVLNFSAPYIPAHFKRELAEIIPFCNIMICNQAEAVSWAASNGLAAHTDLSTIARSIAALPTCFPSRSRLVIVTQGAKATICVDSKDPDNLKIHPVSQLKDEDIVDTNAAGDAFAGGFLAAYISGKSVDECIDVGHRLAGMCVGQVGPQYKWPKEKII